MRILMLIALATLASACAESVAPPQLTGTFQLVSSNGQGLPVAYRSGSDITITGGQLTAVDGGTLELALTVNFPDSGPSSVQFTYPYVLDGDALTITSSSSTDVGGTVTDTGVELDLLLPMPPSMTMPFTAHSMVFVR